MTEQDPQAQAAIKNRLGVLGWPVLHSMSPAMHNAALAAVGLGSSWRYQHLPVPPELFTETVKALPEQGFVGANVTIPHKSAALELADHATERAKAIGAANTLQFLSNGIHADNTDAPGLIAALPFDVAGRSCVVLGAGGSARAVLWALLNAGAVSVRIWNRTSERAVALATEFDAELMGKELPQTDLLVNCTAVGLAGESNPFDYLPIEPADLAKVGCLVDLVYGQSETALVTTARQLGTQTVDGLDFLLAQGAVSFKIWTGKEAPVDVMREALAR